MLQASAKEQNVSPDVYLMICLTNAQLNDGEGLVTGKMLCHCPAAAANSLLWLNGLHWMKHSS